MYEYVSYIYASNNVVIQLSSFMFIIWYINEFYINMNLIVIYIVDMHAMKYS